MQFDILTEWLSSQSLAVVCPMANEEKSAIPFVRQMLEQTNVFQSVLFIAVLDEVSKDSTLSLLEEYRLSEPRLNLIWAPENRNVVDAYVRGYREALMSRTDWILEIDAGFSHKPGDLPNFYPYMHQGYDCVFGSRFIEHGSIKRDSYLRYGLSLGGTYITKALLGTKLADMTSGYQMFSARALQHVIDCGIKSQGPFFQTEIKTYCKNMKIAEVPINYDSPSRKISRNEIMDAITCLCRLFTQRLRVGL